MSYENSLVVTPHVRAGKVRALAVTGAKRSRLMPELPTVSESGLPGYDASGWYGLLAPAATPKTIIARVSAEATKALGLPDVVRALSSQGAEPVGGTPEEFAAFIKSEIDKWAQLVRAAKMKAD